MESARHELGNALGIVLANIEAMVDGVAPPTPERLSALAEAVKRSQELLHTLDEQARGR